MSRAEAAQLRRAHEERVLQTLREHGPLARGEIEMRTGLTRRATAEITADLLARHTIVTLAATPAADRGPGRPASLFALAPGAGRFVGVDFGHRRVLVAAVGPSNDILAREARTYAEDAPWTRRVETAIDLLDSLSADRSIDLGAVEGIGIGMSGPVGASAVALSASWPGAATRYAVDLVTSRFGERYGAPVVIDNNDRYAALAEVVWGSARDVDSLLYVRSSQGVGGGLVIGGEPVVGSHGMAGEIGHVSVPGAGVRCWCGKHGCLETVISTGALLRAARRHDAAIDTIADLAAAADRPEIAAVIDTATDALAGALATVTIVMDPREVIVGGDIAALGDPFFRSLAERFERLLMPVRDALPMPRPAELGDEAGALGAIADAFRRVPVTGPMTGAAPTTRTRTSEARG